MRDLSKLLVAIPVIIGIASFYVANVFFDYSPNSVLKFTGVSIVLMMAVYGLTKNERLSESYSTYICTIYILIILAIQYEVCRTSLWILCTWCIFAGPLIFAIGSLCISHSSNIYRVIKVRKYCINIARISASLIMIFEFVILIYLPFAQDCIISRWDRITIALLSLCFMYPLALIVINIFAHYKYYNILTNSIIEGNFIFFLRSFEMDTTKEEIIISQIKPFTVRSEMAIIRIGNPKLFASNSKFCQTLFLDTPDWKTSVSKYINESRYTFICINFGPELVFNKKGSKITCDIKNITTSGVLWEMFNHTEYMNKFIYHVEGINRFSASDLCSELDSSKKNSPLMNALISLKEISEKNHNLASACTFCFTEGYCFYSDSVKSILEYKIKNNIQMDMTLNSFQL